MTAPKPFSIAIPDEVLRDLRGRLERTRWPDQPDDVGWVYGSNLDYMRRLIAYWRDQFDWRAAEKRINAFPQFTVPVAAAN